MLRYKRYVGGRNCGCNQNCVRLSRLEGSAESLQFMVAAVEIAVIVFGVGLSLDTVCTNYGEVTFRYSSYKKNKKLCTLLIGAVNAKDCQCFFRKIKQMQVVAAQYVI